MPTYVIGDVQGCYDELQDLLKRFQFQPHSDQLWFCGDLVNRGKNSLGVLRFLSELPIGPVIALGNHDLHLLAVASGAARLRSEDTFVDVLEAHDGIQLCQWLTQQKLLHHDEALGFTLSHAGIAPQWDLQVAIGCAREVEKILHENPSEEFYRQLYGNDPACWSDSLTGVARIRFIVNAFTRMRFCDEKGCLDFSFKGKPGEQPFGLFPWFEIPCLKTQGINILFGHWAALEGKLTAQEFMPWTQDVSGGDF